MVKMIVLVDLSESFVILQNIALVTIQLELVKMLVLSMGKMIVHVILYLE